MVIEPQKMANFLGRQIKKEKAAGRKGPILYDWSYEMQDVVALDGPLVAVTLNYYKKQGFSVTQQTPVEVGGAPVTRIVLRYLDDTENYSHLNNMLGLASGYLQADCEVVVYKAQL
jgi:hypothetical protein